MKFAIVSDIHEDIQRLESALKKIGNTGADIKICLGDILGYGEHQQRFYLQPNTKDLIELVHSSFDNIVLGNHDYHHLKINPPDIPGVHFPENWFRLSLTEKKQIAKDNIWYHADDIEPTISTQHAQFLKQFNKPFDYVDENHKLLFSHYLFPNYTGIQKEFFISTSELHPHFHHLEQELYTLSFAGHGHPNGVAVYTKKHMKMISLGACRLSGRLTTVVCPSVSKSERFSGFITYNTTSKLIEIYPLD